MDLIFLHRFQGLLAVVGGDGVVAFTGEIDVQGGDDVPVVVTDKNVIHGDHLVKIVYRRKFKRESGKVLRYFEILKKVN